MVDIDSNDRLFLNSSAVLYTLAKQAKELNYKKLNLQVNNRIQTLRVPPNLQEQVDVSEIIFYDLFR